MTLVLDTCDNTPAVPRYTTQSLLDQISDHFRTTVSIYCLDPDILAVLGY